MPPTTLFDISKIDPEVYTISHDEIYDVIPHRYEFQQLAGICLCDFEAEQVVGVREVRDDEFWVRGHIPGRPIFPGVLMLETAAQLVGYYAMKKMPNQGFLGFGGVTDVKFRGSVVPGDKIVMLGEMVELRNRRAIGLTQAFVNGKMVYQGQITGMWI